MKSKINKKERKISSHFGLYLKNLRESKGLSLADVQSWTGISTSYLNRIEHGERRAPSLPIIYQLSKFYDIPVEEMIKIALNLEKDESEEEITFETLIFSKDFKINDRIINQQIKSKIISLINYIDGMEWDGRMKTSQILEVINKIEELKKELVKG